MVIGLYERRFSARQPASGSRDATSSFYNSVRNMPLLEAFVGTNSDDLYDAIFDVDVIPDEGLFNNLEEDERPALRSIASSAGLRGNRSRGRTPGPGPARNVQSPPLSPMSPTRTAGTPDVSPMRKPITISTASLLEPGQPGDHLSVGKVSPLARLFAGDSPVRGRTVSMQGAGASLKKVETLLEEIKSLPINKVTEEMRELQVRSIFLLTLFDNTPCRRLWAMGFTFNHYPLTIQRSLVACLMAPRVAPLILLPTRRASVESDETDGLSSFFTLIFCFLGSSSAD